MKKQALHKEKIIFGLFMLLGLLGCGGEVVDESAVELIKPIKYEKISTLNNSINQRYAGIVQSSKSAKLSFKVNGNVNYLPTKVGDRVRKGQLLARIDPTDYQVQVEQATSNLMSAQTQIESSQAQLISSRAAYQRIEQLYENNSVSLSAFEQARAALNTAEAAFRAAKAQANTGKKQVEASRNQLSYAKLTAPFAGVITAIYIEENEFVGAGASIIVLNSETKPEVKVGVPEALIANIKKGDEVKIKFAVREDEFEGIVSEVGFSTAGGSTYPVIVQIKKPRESIRPGMAADIQFNLLDMKEDSKPLLYLPFSAVLEDDNGNFAYVLIPESDYYQVEKKEIKIGKMIHKGFEIINGLEEGSLVATSGLRSLIEGNKVRLMDK